jgi:succinoglycan biosynthesis protein ExoM
MLDVSADQDIVTIDICVCTYRRSHLVNTLTSLSRLTVRPNWRVRIIVADNDETPNARKLVESTKCPAPFPIFHVHAPARNISVARNACLDAATAHFVGFIDDDELATPAWLEALIERQERSKADVVLGPVEPRYPAQGADWLRRENFHAIRPVWVKGEILTGYTSNVLLVRDAASLKGLRFDPKLGRSGGEDTVFFAAIHKAGGHIDYAPDAIVNEDITQERLKFFWLIKRAFRSGQTHGLLLLADQGQPLMTRLRNLLLASGKAVFCSLIALCVLPIGGRARYWFLRGTLHAGAVAYMLGRPGLIQYG